MNYGNVQKHCPQGDKVVYYNNLVRLRHLLLIFLLSMLTANVVSMPNSTLHHEYHHFEIETNQRESIHKSYDSFSSSNGASIGRRRQLQRRRIKHPVFSFFVMGDTPYSPRDSRILQRQVKQMAKKKDNGKNALFCVHVGDLMKKGNCRNKNYREASDILFGRKISNILLPASSSPPPLSSLPTVVLPGDNDWIDCPSREVAYKRFSRFFINENNSTRGMDEILSFRRQNQREENFVFWKHNVLFLGLNVSYSNQ